MVPKFERKDDPLYIFSIAAISDHIDYSKRGHYEANGAKQGYVKLFVHTCSKRRSIIIF